MLRSSTSTVLSLHQKRTADFIRHVPTSQGSISFPQPILDEWAQFLQPQSKPQIPEQEISTLVEALDADGSNNCCRLDAIASQTVYMLLRISEPCLAYQRGHCLFAESLHPSRAVSEALQKLQSARKAALAQTNILARLLKAFLDRTRNPRARRWVGGAQFLTHNFILLMSLRMGFFILEILRGSRKNNETLKTVLGQASRRLGEVILHGNDDVLKVVAGSIIGEMLDSGASANEFFPPELGMVASIEFPEMGEQASQWTADFINFVDNLDTQGLLTQERGPLTFAYAVCVNDTTHTTETGLSILVTVSDDLTIVIPSTTEDTTKCIDIPLQNILNATIDSGGSGSQLQCNQASKAAILNLDLKESASAAYYINESKRPSGRISFAFDRKADADIIKDRIVTMERAMLVRKPEEHGLSIPQQDHPVELVSQSVLLDISKDPSNESYDAFGGFGPLEMQASTPTNLKAAAIQANEILTKASHQVYQDDSLSCREGHEHAGDPGDLAARSQVMTGAGAINVSQDIAERSDSAQAQHSPGSLRSSSVWRDGMDAIDNAPELQPKLAATNDNDATDASHVANQDDEDLYTATPPGPKTQPRAGNNNGQSPKPLVKRKLSRTMRVSEGERLSSFPQIGKLPGLKLGFGSGTKQSASTTNNGIGPKWKALEKQPALSNKKAKLESKTARKTVWNSEAGNLADLPIENNIFDLPQTPPDRQEFGKKTQKAGKAKSKAPTNKRADPASKAMKKPAKTHEDLAEAGGKSKLLSKSYENRNGISKLDDRSNPNLLDNGDDNSDLEEPHDITKSATKLTKKRKPQTKSKAKKTLLARSPKVKQESTTRGSKPSAPTRTSQGKRAAAQKAKQQIHDQASNAFEDGAPLHEPRGIQDNIYEAGQLAENLDGNDQSDPFHAGRKDVHASTAKEMSAADGIVDAGPALVAQSAASDAPTAASDDLRHENHLAPVKSATNLSGALGEHEDFYQDYPPTVGNVPSPIVTTSALERGLAGAIVHHGGSTEDKVVDNHEDLIFLNNQGAQLDAAEQGEKFSKTTKGLPIGSEKIISNCEPLHEGPDSINITKGPGAVFSVPPGLDEVVKPTSTNGVHASPVQDPARAGISQMVSTTIRKDGGGAGNAGQKKIPIEFPHAAVKQDDTKEILARGCSPRGDQHSSFAKQRTLPSHLASKLHDSLSGLLNLEDAERQSTETPRLARQQRLQPSSDREAVDEDAKSGQGVAPQYKKSSARKEPDAVKSETLVDLVTKGPHGKSPNTPGLSAAPVVMKIKRKGKPVVEPLTKPDIEAYIIPSGSSSVSNSVDDQYNAPSASELRPPKIIDADLTAVGGNGSSTHSLLPQPLLSKDNPDKKRSLELDDSTLSKKMKLGPSKGLKPIPDSSNTGVGLLQDAYRKPHIISFGPAGPRNQGLSSHKRNTRLEKQADGARRRELPQGQAQERKRDLEVHDNNDAAHDQAYIGELRKSTRMLMENPVRATKSTKDHVRQQLDQSAEPLKRRPLVMQQPRSQPRGLLPAHSSIFGEDLVQHTSSQGSRVDENGSPLPTQRNHALRSSAVKRKEMVEDESDSENVVPPPMEGDTTLVQVEMNEEDERVHGFRAPRGARKGEVEPTRSSNSKHVPSSPTAPSAMLSDLQAHTVQPSGRMINVNTDAVLVPATPQDPFITHNAQRANGFLERLRRATVETGKRKNAAMDRGNGNQNMNRPDPEAVDPDITLVEDERPKRPSKRQRRAAPLSSDTSSTSTSPQTSHSSQESDQHGAARKRWRDALEPHQKNTLDILYEISHQLVGHLIDKETACNDIVNDYQRRGTRFVENLRTDLAREISQYEAIVADRRAHNLANLRKMQAQVTKNLQRSPVAEKVARQFEENQRSWKAKWEAAMRACEEMER
ncbi:MAG: hypothetical protein Q9215_007820 [Flavoplaca cf. flavocitrina]